MSRFLFHSGIFVSFFLLAACGENSSEVSSDKDSLSTENLISDTAAANAVAEERTVEAIEKEELLAENQEEKKSEESSRYIKTELNDVVLSRKTPDGTNSMPASWLEESNGTGDVYRGGLGDKGSGPGENPVERQIISKPEIKNPTQEEGTVSVELLIDPEGKVVKATVLTYGGKTNTANGELIKAARQYSLQYRFNEDASAPELTKLTIHIEFTL